MKDYFAGVRVRRREVFVPLAHPPGHAQIDFGQAIGTIGGRRVTLHLFCMHLPHSDASFVKAYPSFGVAAAAGLPGWALALYAFVLASAGLFVVTRPSAVLLDPTDIEQKPLPHNGSTKSSLPGSP